MPDAQSPSLIVGAWPDQLARFVRETQHELLVASPWITASAARLIAQELLSTGPITIQILARLDEKDFVAGTSHIVAFRSTTYPSQARVLRRALPLLHAKMLISDRKRVIVGSANLTDGGLYRNHEVALAASSLPVGQACAQEFFRLWSLASEVPDDYLDTIEVSIAASIPPPDEGSLEPAARRQAARSRPVPKVALFRYQPPLGATSARRSLLATLALPKPAPLPPESIATARFWLSRGLRFLPASQRNLPEVIQRLEELMYHPDVGIRASAIDRAGRSANRVLLPRLHVLATNPSEPPEVRSAATFAIAILCSPESFALLQTLHYEESDVGRWATRGCFLLLGAADEGVSLDFLRELGAEDPAAVIRLARDWRLQDGSIAERLTKGLCLEKLATGRWSDSELFLLTCIMALTAHAIQAFRRRVKLPGIVRYASEALGVSPGDLRHGPLAPSLLEKFALSGPPELGLQRLFSSTWTTVVNSPAAAREHLRTHHLGTEIVRLLDETALP